MRNTDAAALNSERRTVLIVDDDCGILSLLRLILEQSGYDVLEAWNGKEAITCLSLHSVDLVVMDLVMPEQEGLATISQIRCAFPLLRIIAMSGAFEGKMLRAARLLGATETLNKPFTPETVLGKVRQALGG